MSSKATILLTTDNEHWYEELNAPYWEETKTERAIVLEIRKQHKYEVVDDGLRVIIEEGAALYQEIIRLRYKGSDCSSMLDEINALMWQSHMINQPIPGDKIMEILNRWAGKY